MKKIKQNELFQSLSGFLKDKGIELKEGTYAERIHKACNLLGDTINATQSTARKAKQEVDKKLDEVRECIHEATAPRPPEAPAQKPASTGVKKTGKTQPGAKKTAKPQKGNPKQ